MQMWINEGFIVLCVCVCAHCVTAGLFFCIFVQCIYFSPVNGTCEMKLAIWLCGSHIFTHIYPF